MFVRSEEEVDVVVEAESEVEVLGARVDTSIASTIGFATKNWRSLRVVLLELERGGVSAFGVAEVVDWDRGVAGLAAEVVCP